MAFTRTKWGLIHCVHEVENNFLFVPLFSGTKKMSKKRKVAEGGTRKLVQPIPLDSSGRPVFPIVLGGLTVYSLGEVSHHLPITSALKVFS